MKKILCKKCKQSMEFLGNISNIIYASYPPQWDEVYICRNCKEKKTLREHGALPSDYSFVNDYFEQKETLK